MRKRKKLSLSLGVWIFLFANFSLILCICTFKIISWSKDNNDTSKIINEIEENTHLEEVDDDENTKLVNESENNDSPYWYYTTFPLINVDFTSLKEINNDTIAWINVNNTNINYPVVQSSDNNYYLNHSFDKSVNEAGWVFLDYRNNSNLENRNSIIYAHSRLDKTMFGSLSKTLKNNWYTNKDNHIIRVSTENENTLWQIFSVYKIKEESYYITTDFNDKTYLEFLNTIKGRSIYDFNTNLTIDDKIITLSTCYSDTERTVVHAKLIKKQDR